MDESDCSALPTRISIFPLDGAVLFPGERMPLNIFEPRYLDMVADALNGDGLIGMVQPRDPAQYSSMARAEVYDVGCVGRIVEHSETDDGRHLILLEGISRFRVVDGDGPGQDAGARAGADTTYRRVGVRYDEFSEDREGAVALGTVRDELLTGLRGFLDRLGVEADWAALDALPDDGLVHTLAMSSPFPGNEKQALLEAPSLRARALVLTTLMTLSMSAGQGPTGAVTH